MLQGGGGSERRLWLTLLYYAWRIAPCHIYLRRYFRNKSRAGVARCWPLYSAGFCFFLLGGSDGLFVNPEVKEGRPAAVPWRTCDLSNIA